MRITIMSLFTRLKAGARSGEGVMSLHTSARQLSERLAALRFEPTYLAGEGLG